MHCMSHPIKWLAVVTNGQLQDITYRAVELKEDGLTSLVQESESSRKIQSFTYVMQKVSKAVQPQNDPQSSEMIPSTHVVNPRMIPEELRNGN